MMAVVFFAILALCGLLTAFLTVAAVGSALLVFGGGALMLIAGMITAPVVDEPYDGV